MSKINSSIGRKLSCYFNLWQKIIFKNAIAFPNLDRQMTLSQSSFISKTDCIFTWHSETAATECRCRLRIFQISFDKTIVIVSELPDNPGRSITDEALTLIHLVCHQFKLNLKKTMWFEHYPSGYLKDDEVYEQILFTPFSVRSYRISQHEIKSLIL